MWGWMVVGMVESGKRYETGFAKSEISWKEGFVWHC